MKQAPRYDLDLSAPSAPPSTYVAPESVGSVGTRKSDIEIGFSDVLETRDEWHAARCLREVFGLEVASVRHALHLDLETVSASVERFEASEAKRVSDIVAARAARLTDMQTKVGEYDRARRAFAKNVIPKKTAIAARLRAEHGADEHLAAFLKAVDDAAEQGLPGSETERFYNEQLREAEREVAKPVPSEDLETLRLQQNPRGWSDRCLALLRAVRAEKLAQHVAEVARARRIVHLAGGL